MINNIEKILLTSSLIIIIIPIVILLSLIINGLYEFSTSAIEYYNNRSSQREFCLEVIASSSDYETYWKDETIFGFGEEGSYGCFVTDNKKGN